MYDHILFHTEEDYPAGLPEENAATHIGMYFQWAASQGLVNPVWQSAPETAADFAAMQQGSFSGAQFVLKHMGGAITPDDFTDVGQWFTEFYYDDEEDGYGAFMEDYVAALDTPSLGSIYHVADTPENFAALAPVFQTAFNRWAASLKR
ncbi:DUF7832 domain-containing protein [Neisseria animalis]|uniref:Cell surface protein n=1 Tax=Neisseria animalis TaxID=492 RepID=A0A5P3MRL2_NEIAN|nr:cell surface protein [Neisseria animalis]QEY24090.1 cell surface protein [Neisseria animalis]ROW32659.1 cell surface protein [Neisseria animalis]VEE06256.1 Uncharacterised protein [Neisseria animalis]